jgi:hypothetical protein
MNSSVLGVLNLLVLCVSLVGCRKSINEEIGQFEISKLRDKVYIVSGDTILASRNIVLVPFKGDCSMCLVELKRQDDLIRSCLSEEIKLCFLAIESDNMLIEYMAESLNVKSTIIGVNSSEIHCFSLFESGYVYFIGNNNRIFRFEEVNKRNIKGINSLALKNDFK